MAAPEQQPYSIYVDADDKVVVTVWTSLSLASSDLILWIRFLTIDGKVQTRKSYINSTSDRIRTRNYIGVGGPGWIIGISLLVDANTATPRVGQVYATIGLAKYLDGANTHITSLLSGYVLGRDALSWPPGLQHSSVEGPGLIRSITGTDPAAGAEISETVPTNARWKLISLSANLVTDATAANRNVYFIIDDGATILFQSSLFFNQSASVAARHSFGALTVQTGTLSGSIISTHAGPCDCLLFQGYRVRTATLNLQPGDNWGQPQLWVEEWIEE